MVVVKASMPTKEFARKDWHLQQMVYRRHQIQFLTNF